MDNPEIKNYINITYDKMEFAGIPEFYFSIYKGETEKTLIRLN